MYLAVMKHTALILSLVSAAMLCGCRSKAPAAGLPETVGSGVDTGHYVLIGGLEWKKYNIGATALPSENWELSLGSYFSYANRATLMQKHCVNGWRIPTEEDYSKIRPSRIMIQREWRQIDRKTYAFRDSTSGISYEVCQPEHRQYFVRVIQECDTLEFPAAGYPARERSVGLNGIYMTTTMLDGQFIRAYYLDRSILTIHKWGHNGNISVRLVRDSFPDVL